MLPLLWSCSSCRTSMSFHQHQTQTPERKPNRHDCKINSSYSCPSFINKPPKRTHVKGLFQSVSLLFYSYNNYNSKLLETKRAVDGDWITIAWIKVSVLLTSNQLIIDTLFYYSFVTTHSSEPTFGNRTRKKNMILDMTSAMRKDLLYLLTIKYWFSIEQLWYVSLCRNMRHITEVKYTQKGEPSWISHHHKPNTNTAHG